MRKTMLMHAVLTFLLLTLVACNAPAVEPTNVPAETSNTPAPDASTYPLPAATADSAYPLPTPQSPYPGPGGGAAGAVPTVAAESGPLVVPTPGAETGVVIGKFLNNPPDGTGVVPIAGRILFLGRVISNAAGVEGLVEIDRLTAPNAVINADGEFAFIDITPGSYGVMIDTVQGPQLLNDPETGVSMVVEVVAGQIVDIGEKTFVIPSNF
ncbi:hypothetical protein HC891_00960 [Candidatus Gracilibacteria bacterium]|nr:hypothetical protein [Candidatus Gracilibacteria bacterium]